MELENRVVVISGASGGLGRVVTEHLAKQGANLVLLGRSIDPLTNLVKKLGIPNEKILVISVDLGDPKATTSAAKTAIRKFGKIDIVLHLVGGWTGGKSVLEFALEDVNDMLQQHVWTTIHLTRAFVPHMLDNGWGRFIAISSPFAAQPRAKGAPYAIGKAAQEALIKTLAQEQKGTDVTANILLVKSIDLAHKRILEPSTKNVSWTTPEEIIRSILYLMSEDAGVINGARIPLYGSP